MLKALCTFVIKSPRVSEPGSAQKGSGSMFSFPNKAVSTILGGKCSIKTARAVYFNPQHSKHSGNLPIILEAEAGGSDGQGHLYYTVCWRPGLHENISKTNNKNSQTIKTQ